MGAFIKHRGLGRLAIAAALMLGGCATVPPTDAPKLAITIDDLPVHGPIPAGMSAVEVNRQMIQAIKDAHVPGVTVFVNGRWTESNPETVGALAEWQKAGIAMGNHGWSHQSLDAVSVDQYQDEISRNESVLERYSGGRDWRWYRFPYLHEGEDPAKRLAIRSFLADRGYRIASVTTDFSDWKFTATYARCKAAKDAAAIAEMERLYLDALRANLDVSRRLGRAVYGREIPLVLLMHVGAFSAHMMPRVIAEYRKAGIHFVSLAEAQADPAYAEDNDPRLPPRSQYLAARAAARGITVPQLPDVLVTLNAMCPGGPMTSTP